MTGYALDQLPGAPEPFDGDNNTFLARLDAAGRLLGTHQQGSLDHDRSFGAVLIGTTTVVAGQRSPALIDGRLAFVPDPWGDATIVARSFTGKVRWSVDINSMSRTLPCSLRSRR